MTIRLLNFLHVNSVDIWIRRLIVPVDSYTCSGDHCKWPNGCIYISVPDYPSYSH